MSRLKSYHSLDKYAINFMKWKSSGILNFTNKNCKFLEVVQPSGFFVHKKETINY